MNSAKEKNHIYNMCKGKMETYKLTLKATKLYGSDVLPIIMNKLCNVNHNVNKRIV